MFAEMTTKYIQGAIGSETENAIKNYGEKYASLHEGYAVLKEETDEARDEEIQIKNNMYELWELIKINKKEEVQKRIKNIREHAEKLALEAVQICAVCDKINKTII